MLYQPYFSVLLAQAYGKMERVEEGLTVVAEALATIDKTRERNSEAELYRLKGELLLAQEGLRPQAEGAREKTEEAEGCFLRAIEIAQKQQGKSLELRAVMSLVRLLQYQAQNHESRNTQHKIHNRLNEAHKMLSDVYNWFTEGFGTKDLQEAKALLEELS